MPKNPSGTGVCVRYVAFEVGRGTESCNNPHRNSELLYRLLSGFINGGRATSDITGVVGKH